MPPVPWRSGYVDVKEEASLNNRFLLYIHTHTHTHMYVYVYTHNVCM
jgi:hypothetical protein